MPWAASPEAHSAAEACQALMAANRKRSITVQWMPSETDKGCRFEIIGVSTGALLGEVLIDEAGRVVLRYA